MPSSTCDGAAMPIDALLIESTPDQVHGSCTIRLETYLDHWMISFKTMKLSCGQYVKLYYNINGTGKPDVSIPLCEIVLKCATNDSVHHQNI